MNRLIEPTFDHRIADWLEEDPNHAPREVLGTVLAAYPSISQRHASRLPWRLPTMFNNRAFVGAAAAVLVVALASGTYLTLRSSDPSIGSSPSPAAAASSSPPSSAADAFGPYRDARDAACQRARTVFSANTDLVGLYDPSVTGSRRETLNARQRTIAEAVATLARDLANLQPPAQLATAHATDVGRQEDLAALFAVQSQLLASGQILEARSLEMSFEALGQLRQAFEEDSGLPGC